MNDKIGLVLSGGGAKGAYHVGVMQAMQELNIPVDMIAGASIGALNGAILASAPNLNEGITRMKNVWRVLPEQNPIQFGVRGVRFDLSPKQSLGYITFLVSAGLKFSNPIGIATTLVQNLEVESIIKDDVLQDLLQEYLDLSHLQKSIPLYVSIFPQTHNGKALTDFYMGIKDGFQTEILGINNHSSEFRHIQSLPLEQQKETILASSALPLLFKAYQDENQSRYTDGGQGGMIKSQGNTPIEPLIKAGCKHIVVVHLDGTSLWHRHDFPEASIIEIRPSIDMGGFGAMLDFSEATVTKLIQTGYQDAITTFKKVQASLGSLYAMRDSTERLKEVGNSDSSQNLENAMARLRASK
ncbi:MULTISPECIES: patatin-like phospholipase family protein [unclassified Moraxella]|uniref:patatin-like phospholipase family protein n=1 Tax=unclassified Moraxella TaxID=2685852 RepID=UPI003AF5BA02